MYTCCVFNLTTAAVKGSNQVRIGTGRDLSAGVKRCNDSRASVWQCDPAVAACLEKLIWLHLGCQLLARPLRQILHGQKAQAAERGCEGCAHAGCGRLAKRSRKTSRHSKDKKKTERKPVHVELSIGESQLCEQQQYAEHGPAFDCQNVALDVSQVSAVLFPPAEEPVEGMTLLKPECVRFHTSNRCGSHS